MGNKNNEVKTYSENQHAEGRVLLIGLGGAGIEMNHENMNENMKESLDLVPYLSKGAKQIDYVALTQKDSADLTATDISNISKSIHACQNDYDGFVVIGGTDTMPYFASATAFALRGMGTPIVFTGATQSAREWDSDFRLNLPNAIKTAVMGCKDINAPSVGEVCILFDDTLSRATTSINRGTRSNNPMETPRVPRLGDVGWTVKLESITSPRIPSQLNYSHNTGQDIAYFDLVSQTHVSAFDTVVDDPTLRGIVIGAFGAGNIPAILIPSIHRAVYEKGKVVAVITNCKKGSSDMGLYDCGALAVKAGAVSLGPMTKPAAIEKLRYALNNAKGNNTQKFLQDAVRLLLTSVAQEVPDNFSRHATNVMKESFLTKTLNLNDFFKEPEQRKYDFTVKKYCTSPNSKYKILVISMGGTFFQEPNPEGSLTPTTRKISELFDKKFYEIHKFVNLDYIELANLDSTDVDHDDRKQLARAIAKNVDNYDGIVVLHGTDTMSYTAASISYMLVGIKKDVMVTGAQKPGFDSSDFDRNFIKSIKAIITRLEQPEKERVCPGVKVAFGDKLINGAVVVKQDEHGINAFAPNDKHPLSGTLSHHVELVNTTKDVPKRPFALFTDFDTSVAYFECINAIDIKQFEQYVENPTVTGILVGGYDGGNMPMQMKYYISTAVNSYGKPVAFVSNNDNGVAEPTLNGRLGDFEKAGAIALGDMIKESAFQKMCFALGLANKQKGLKGRKRIEFVRKILHTNLVGEISNKYCEQAEDVYKGIFVDKNLNLFSDEEINKYISEAKEDPKQEKKKEPEKPKVEAQKLVKKEEKKPKKPEPINEEIKLNKKEVEVALAKG